MPSARLQPPRWTSQHKQIIMNAFNVSCNKFTPKQTFSNDSTSNRKTTTAAAATFTQLLLGIYIPSIWGTAMVVVAAEETG